jgi:hypothetical protein
MLPLDLLRVALAWGVLVSVEMTRVRAPIIGVMVVLHRVCCHFRQIVMADAPLDGPDVMLDCLGERQRCTDETGESLPERIVEPLNVIGYPRFPGHCFVPVP